MYRNILCIINTILIPSFTFVFIFLGATIPLKHILDHTFTRLDQTLVYPAEFTRMKLTLKWGADGSSGLQKFHQKPTDESLNIFGLQGEGNVFIISLVPLILTGISEAGEEAIIWENPKPSSHRWCRPIKLLYLKESKELVCHEINAIKKEISKLTQSNINGKQIDYEMRLTMVDGKCISLITGFSSQSCYICGAKSKIMNNLEDLRKRDIIEENLSYGITPLHLWIRFLEFTLNIGYSQIIQFRLIANKRS